jgi:hypothetical protein
VGEYELEGICDFGFGDAVVLDVNKTDSLYVSRRWEGRLTVIAFLISWVTSSFGRSRSMIGMEGFSGAIFATSERGLVLGCDAGTRKKRARVSVRLIDARLSHCGAGR